MEEKREEIYERIPWETIENPKSDRQTLVIGIAAAVVAGALVYSFMGSRSVPPSAQIEPDSAQIASEIGAPVSPPGSLPVAITPAPPLASGPQSISEADLYAIPPETLLAVAAGHAEWFVLEYLTIDGSAENPTLRLLLPGDIPLPTAPAGTKIFVEWVGALAVEEIEVGLYSVDVLARYLVASDGENYQRVDPEMLSVTVRVTASGPQVVTAPVSSPMSISEDPTALLGDVPAQVADLVVASHPDATIVGGVITADGRWHVVVVVSGPGGLMRPETIVIGP